MKGLKCEQGLQGSRSEHVFQAHFTSRIKKNLRCGEGGTGLELKWLQDADVVIHFLSPVTYIFHLHCISKYQKITGNYLTL